MANAPQTPVAVCALCKHEAHLLQSHVIPAFVGRYLKETSATGYLRSGLNPNLRVQDLRKVPLLCDECELRISKWEREFSIHAFPGIQSDGFVELPYGEWLLKFAVSLAWRVLVTNNEGLIADFPQFREPINETLEKWRQYLLGHRNNPGTEHHLFIFSGIPSSVPPDAHEKLLMYMLRGIDATPVVSQRLIAVYVKLIRGMFYAPISPVSPAGWRRTRIHSGSGRILSPQEISMRGFGDFLNSRVEHAFAKNMSEAQRMKMERDALKDPQRALDSETFRVQMAMSRLSRRRR